MADNSAHPPVALLEFIGLTRPSAEICKEEIQPPSMHLFSFPALVFSTRTEHASHSLCTIHCVLSAMSPLGLAVLSGCAGSHTLITESSSYLGNTAPLGYCNLLLYSFHQHLHLSQSLSILDTVLLLLLFFNLHLNHLFSSLLKKIEDLCYVPINSS